MRSSGRRAPGLRIACALPAEPGDASGAPRRRCPTRRRSRRGWRRRPKAARCRRRGSPPSSTRSRRRAGTHPSIAAPLEGTPLATAVDALLLHGDANRPWRALLSLQPADGKPLDAGRIRSAIAEVPGAPARRHQARARTRSTRATCARPNGRRRSALSPWSRCSALALRSTRRLVVVLLPIAAAATVVLAALTASGAALGILHLVGLLLTVAIGSNYALFFDHLRRADEVDEDTLASLLLANLTTVISFGLLASSQIPVLQAVGAVVAPGTLLCLVFSASFIGRPERAAAHGKIAA
jgi:hypothetical protein